MNRRMVSWGFFILYSFPSLNILLILCAKLSKEDEVAASADEVEVRREDQDKINKFSRLHQRELSLEEELAAKNVRPSVCAFSNLY